ncbi:hypothetical protein GGQ79_002695 [Ochrobactrum pecoris]|uniref:Uncharacterized protein n=1 Tax=Brucella pecoris TaxID=867683 RepID=A0AB34YYI7_9HYPH|nr:hypothetical protein [Brucella pecoris]
MLRQSGYPPHRTFDGPSVERRAGSRQAFKNVIMRYDLDKGRIAFSLIFEGIKKAGLLVISDNENAFDERRKFDDGSDVVVNLAIIEITFARYSLKMCTIGIRCEFFSGSHMRRVLPIDPCDYVIDVHYKSHNKLQFYDGNISVQSSLQNERMENSFNFGRPQTAMNLQFLQGMVIHQATSDK